MAANNHNLFPLPYWAPALWRVPMPLQLVTEAYRWGCRCESDQAAADGLNTLHAAPAPLAFSPRPTFRGQRENGQ
jgi:hypothetical protein